MRAGDAGHRFGARGKRGVGSGECRPVAFGLAIPVAQRDEERETEGPAATRQGSDSSGGDVSAVPRRGARHEGTGGAEATGDAEGTASLSGAR